MCLNLINQFISCIVLQEGAIIVVYKNCENGVVTNKHDRDDIVEKIVETRTKSSIPQRLSGLVLKPKTLFGNKDEAHKRARKRSLDAHFGLFNERDFQAILTLNASLTLSKLSELQSIATVIILIFHLLFFLLKIKRIDS